MKFDVFISHAREDTAEIAHPLAETLRSQGLRVQLNGFELTHGESLRHSIDLGLATAKLGVVIISPEFLRKDWQLELEDLFTRKVQDRKVILPVMHNLVSADVSAYSPFIANRLAISTTDGLAEVAKQIGMTARLFGEAEPPVYDVVRGTEAHEVAQPALPPTSSEETQRYLTARTQERVQLREEFALIVRLATQPVPPGPGASSTAVGPVVGTLTIDLYAPDFRLLDGSKRTIEASRTGDSAPVRFGLRAERTGVLDLRIDAWNGSAYVAGLSVKVAVEAVGVMEAAGAADMDMRAPESGEYTLEVVYESSLNRYRFQLRGEDVGVLEPVYSDPLVGDKLKVIQGLTNDLNRQARNLNQYTPKQMQAWLKGLGSLLYKHLIPEELKHNLWDQRGRIRRLNILSPGDSMPWEVLYMMDGQTGDGAFLADSATVARWRYGAPPPVRLGRMPTYIVLPPGAPTQAQREYERLKALFPFECVSDLDSLIDLVENGGFGLLHFAAHNVNAPGVQGGSYVPFGDSRFDLNFMGAVPQNRYRTEAPLVFMNACTSAGTSPLYTETAGWADSFLMSGSGAFIGALWEVRDKSAFVFSDVIYSELKVGKNLGEAMRLGRKAIGASDPTYLAYTLYGNPLATLE